MQQLQAATAIANNGK
ncbi:hypothetical protein PO124_05775 [Bacillus licheniformis]|nr:hypothetical protein [Bacillus licheniformis]